MMKKQKRFTLGMAVSNDFNGVWMTCQTAILNNPNITQEGEILIIDNEPDSPEGKATAEYASKNPIITYIPMAGRKGTAVRDLIFRKANAPVVVCVDAHVLLPGDSLMQGVKYLEMNADRPIILSGPMLYDDGIQMATHWEPEWRNAMYGIWATNVPALKAGEPFEIPMCGLGQFASRKEHWQGFNPLFAAFGGEEFYIHEKYRRVGGAAICLPSFKWNHRFQRVSRGYTFQAWQQIRNYVIGWDELGLDMKEMLEHFKNHWNPAVVVEGYSAAMSDIAASRSRGQSLLELSAMGIISANPIVTH